MARAEFRAILLGLAATGLLSACVDGGGSGGSDAPALLAPVAKSSNREVEAPDVFQTTDSALWDGRPSLGGIWVASPDVTSPERVVMVNLATGATVNGALFKRERDNPGPTLQLSSDAAEALGILAGQPTEIRVTALRKEEVAAPVETETESDAGTEPAEAAPDAEAAETAALAAAALDAADAGVTGAEPAAEAAVEAAAEASPEGTAETPVEPPKKKTWKERRAEAKAKREAEKAAKAAAAAAAEAPPEGMEPVDPEASAVAEIETAPLDARAPDAVATDPAPAAETAAETAPAATGESRPIQIASFSKEENANRAVEALAKIGIEAKPQKSEQGGKPVWGVVAMGDAALLQKIKDAGFADAYFLK